MVGDEKPKSGKDLAKYKVCGQYKKNIKDGQRITLRCKNKPSGKFVFVYLPRKGVLKLCKVKVYKKGEPPVKPKPEEPEEPEEPEGKSYLLAIPVIYMLFVTVLVNYLNHNSILSDFSSI